MPRSDQWKPCDSLRAEDFERHALWGFDLSRESDPEADETWVRPYELAEAPATSDVLFIAVSLRLARGDTARGAVCFRFRKGVPVVEDVMLLNPRYMPTSARGRGPPAMQTLIERGVASLLGGRVEEIFPIAYEGHVPIGAGVLEVRGTVESEARG